MAVFYRKWHNGSSNGVPGFGFNFIKRDTKFKDFLINF